MGLLAASPAFYAVFTVFLVGIGVLLVLSVRAIVAKAKRDKAAWEQQRAVATNARDTER